MVHTLYLSDATEWRVAIEMILFPRILVPTVNKSSWWITKILTSHSRRYIIGYYYMFQNHKVIGYTTSPSLF